MTVEEKLAKRAEYMREYNSRPEPHFKKLMRDNEYRQRNLEKIRAYDRQRSQQLERRVANWKDGQVRRQRPEVREYHKLYYEANKEKFRAKERLRRSRITESEWKDLQHRYGMKHRHGITPEQYEEMLSAQNGKCALCFADNGAYGINGRLHIDHDHTTGKIRGLLCMHCNHAIERLDNHDGWASRAEEYLRRSR